MLKELDKEQEGSAESVFFPAVWVRRGDLQSYAGARVAGYRHFPFAHLPERRVGGCNMTAPVECTLRSVPPG